MSQGVSTDGRAESAQVDPVAGDATAGAPGERRGRRAVAGRVATALAGLLVLFALVTPNQFGRLTPGAFVRIPIEGLLAVATLLVLPPRARRVVAALLGVLLGLLTILKLADLGFSAALDRPSDPMLDWALLDDAVGFVSDSFGHAGAIGAVIGAVVLVAAVLVLMTLSALRLARLVGRHDRIAVRVVATLAVAWLACAAFGVRIVAGVPVADWNATALVYDHTRQARAGLHDRKTFATQVAATDPFAETPADQLLTGLRGKDVLIAFVESYGRVAVENPEIGPQVGRVLDEGTSRLRAAGFGSRSGFLTSSTAGGGSWLAHSTLLSGLWIDNQQRDDRLLASDRLTLNGAFRRAGWQTVGMIPAANQPWPEGERFFGYDRYYDGPSLGYRGPTFAYAPMPDQFSLAALRRLELGKPGHAPIMAEIPLVSSHSPWTEVPQLIDWNDVGDGSVFNGPQANGEAPNPFRHDTPGGRGGYAQSIQYSLNTLVSYVEKYGNDNTVLIFLGDHQPAPVITGGSASRDVPVSIVAHDPKVLDRISGWGWQDGLKPGPQVPVWRMSDFRDRFLTAFGP